MILKFKNFKKSTAKILLFSFALRGCGGCSQSEYPAEVTNKKTIISQESDKQNPSLEDSLQHYVKKETIDDLATKKFNKPTIKKKTERPYYNFTTREGHNGYTQNGVVKGAGINKIPVDICKNKNLIK